MSYNYVELGEGAPNSKCNRLFCWTILQLLALWITVGTLVFIVVGGLGSSPLQVGSEEDKRLVCYFSTSGKDNLSLLDVPGDLCTHINIGIAQLENGTELTLSTKLKYVLQHEATTYRAANPRVKLLLWIGGADSGAEFVKMVVNHKARKQFLVSLRTVLKTYKALTGIDLDWEFPRAYDKQRQHLSQLLYEIRKEWQREKHEDYVLSIAVAAPEGIALYAYDIRELNLYTNYVNLMAYDFHFYRKDMPFTGLNAPLYARSTERSLMGTFNINYTVSWWLKQGLEPSRLVVGLPTYGHSFTLVNPFNKRIGAAASDFGECGEAGYTTSSETCECAAKHLAPVYDFDKETCSPYLSVNREWISYENQESIACKANYIKSLNVGGIMIFSLNTDDLRNSCGYKTIKDKKPVFPLTQIAKKSIFDPYWR